VSKDFRANRITSGRVASASASEALKVTAGGLSVARICRAAGTLPRSRVSPRAVSKSTSAACSTNVTALPARASEPPM